MSAKGKRLPPGRTARAGAAKSASAKSGRAHTGSGKSPSPRSASAKSVIAKSPSAKSPSAKSAVPLELQFALKGDKQLAENVIVEVLAAARRLGIKPPRVQVLRKARVGPKRAASSKSR